MRRYQSVLMSARHSVYTQNVWNRPIKMECTKFKKKIKEAKNLYAHT